MLKPGRQTIMLMTRCLCKRVLTTTLTGPHPHALVIPLYERGADPLAIPDMTKKAYARRFEHRREYDKETGLPIFYEEGMYA
jgi:hypothetical protein